MSKDTNTASTAEGSTASGAINAASVDEIQPANNERLLSGASASIIFIICVGYIGFHLYALNIQPVETWTYRIIHVSFGLMIGFLLLGATSRFNDDKPQSIVAKFFGIASIILSGYALALVVLLWLQPQDEGTTGPLAFIQSQLGLVSFLALAISLFTSYCIKSNRKRLNMSDLSLGFIALAVAGYLILSLSRWRLMAGTSMVGDLDFYMSTIGVVLILELTRRVAGMALVIITGVFILYAFIGPWLPGIFEHRGYSPARFFTYLYTDNGVLAWISHSTSASTALRL
ncbi:hypothetical protein [Vreelandella maris]|uniref:Uncharacterized protein n=1 Tax=Vreelandella maris TaxID=2729617 RepID=A0A7Y6RGL5_9GAMM|nr:hypothetical protein [Halomonas maris]NVF16582.1 hypothetical protein [Halomonas maris]